MNDTSPPNGSAPLQTSSGHRSRFRHWWNALKAALAAGEAYESARARGLPRDAAANSAFKAVSTDDPPASPPIASA